MDKRAYQRPEVRVKRVRVESPVCAGSVEIIAPTEGQHQIQDQSVNTDFGENYTPQATDWD